MEHNTYFCGVNIITLKQKIMKKYLFMLLAMLPLMMFTACSSDDDTKAPTLDGTTWVNDEDGVKTITFQGNTFTFHYINKEYGESDTDKGTYTYDPPFVNFTAINRETNKVETQSGRIDGNQLSFGELIYRKK